MFEKEVEDYVMREDVITENDRVPFDNGYGFQTVSFENEVKKGFQDGAEFGYNKANEWHYVKYGDYPKDNKPVLCILGDISEESYEVGYFSKERLYKSTEWWHFETYELPDDDGDNAWGVSAWKEIVPPKESE